MSYFDISINLNMRCIEIQIHNKNGCRIRDSHN